MRFSAFRFCPYETRGDIVILDDVLQEADVNHHVGVPGDRSEPSAPGFSLRSSRPAVLLTFASISLPLSPLPPPAGQCDLLLLSAPAGILHLPELQQLPVASLGGGGDGGVLRSLPVPDVEPGRASAVSAAEPGAPETGAEDQQQPALPDPAELRATESRGLSG